MRGFIVMAMFLAGFANSAWKDDSEARDLELDPADIGELKIHGSGGVSFSAVRVAIGEDS